MSRIADRLAVAGLILGCYIGWSPSHAQRLDPGAAADNVASFSLSDMPWTQVSPEYRFISHSAASRLIRTPGFVRTQLGYFTDGPMLAQYTAGQLREMRRNRAGFVVSLDLDGDGRRETYRTGHWRRDYRYEGTFLVVFEANKQKDLIVTGDGGTFMSWLDGGLILSDCNCPRAGHVSYRNGKLKVDWN